MEKQTCFEDPKPKCSQGMLELTTFFETGCMTKMWFICVFCHYGITFPLDILMIANGDSWRRGSVPLWLASHGATTTVTGSGGCRDTMKKTKVRKGSSETTEGRKVFCMNFFTIKEGGNKRETRMRIAGPINRSFFLVQLIP